MYWEENMDNIDISVVVPVYNVENYLCSCLDSILMQTFENIEVLVINDGSTDKSGEICDEYAKRDGRIRVFHRKNGGVYSARKWGIDNAVGNYVMFVDSDDIIPYNSLAIMYNEIRGGRYSIVVGNGGLCQYDISKEEYCHRVIDGTMPSFLWGKLFNAKLFSKGLPIIPRKIMFGEDMLVNIWLAFANIMPVHIINQHVYTYSQRIESCTHTFVPTVEYEYLFHRYRLMMIPENERINYVKDTIKSRLNALRQIVIFNKAIDVYRNTLFYADLYNDIKMYDYSLSWWDILMIEQRLVIVRKLAIIGFKIRRKLLRMVH